VCGLLLLLWSAYLHFQLVNLSHIDILRANFSLQEWACECTRQMLKCRISIFLCVVPLHGVQNWYSHASRVLRCGLCVLWMCNSEGCNVGVASVPLVFSVQGSSYTGCIFWSIFTWMTLVEMGQSHYKEADWSLYVCLSRCDLLV
jgi:hypothetical protein